MTPADSDPTTSLEDRARAALAAVAKKDPGELRDEQEMIRDLQLDSVATLDLLMELEEVLGAEISETEAAALVTVGDVVQFVRTRAG